MKLIPRRKKKPTPFEQGAKFAKLGVKGLVAQRLLRRGLRSYKFSRRAIPLAGLAALAAVVAKKLGGRGGGGTPDPSPPASTGPSAGTTATAAATAGTGSPPLDGAPAAGGPEVTDSLADAGVEGSGPDTPKEAAAPGVGDQATPTDETLDVEAPNESTPPPPDKTSRKK